MLEEMPWVVRYNWMASLTETQFGALNSNVAPYPLNELGETYNNFVWNRTNTHNPQWGDNAGGKFVAEIFMKEQISTYNSILVSLQKTMQLKMNDMQELHVRSKSIFCYFNKFYFIQVRLKIE